MTNPLLPFPLVSPVSTSLERVCVMLGPWLEQCAGHHQKKKKKREREREANRAGIGSCSVNIYSSECYFCHCGYF